MHVTFQEEQAISTLFFQYFKLSIVIITSIVIINTPVIVTQNQLFQNQMLAFLLNFCWFNSFLFYLGGQ